MSVPVPPDRTFRSRVDAWLVAVVFTAAALPLLLGGFLFLRGAHAGVVLLVGWGSIMSLMVGVLSFPLRYTLRADALHIQSGWLEWDLPYSALRRVAPSRNPLTAPAWSLRRVRLDNADGSFTLVSPDDQESFIKELADRCPHLARDGSGLEALPSPHEASARQAQRHR